MICYVYVVAVHGCHLPRHCCQRPPPLPPYPPPPSILIASTPVRLAVLGIDDGNNDHVPPLIVLSRMSLVHLQNFLQNFRPHPSADAEGGGGCDGHHDRSYSVLAAATMTMTTMYSEDGETTLVHSHGSRMIHRVHSPSLPGCHRRRPPAARRRDEPPADNDNKGEEGLTTITLAIGILLLITVDRRRLPPPPRKSTPPLATVTFS